MAEEQKAENEAPVAETEVVESPPAEEKTVETKTPEVSETPKVPESKPVEKRIHKLVDERDRERAEKESLAKQVEELTAKLSGQPEGELPQVQTIEPGTEVTSEQYKQDVVRTAQSIAQLEVQKQRIIDTINKESLESMKVHPELDPDSDVFDKELSDTITDSVRAQIQANPTASVRKLVDRLMKPYRRAVEKKVAENTETITKQVSETAVRPTQVKGVEKPFEDLSEREMEEKLGVVY